jgi:hypothetical protein
MTFPAPALKALTLPLQRHRTVEEDAADVASLQQAHLDHQDPTETTDRTDHPVPPAKTDQTLHHQPNNKQSTGASSALMLQPVHLENQDQREPLDLQDNPELTPMAVAVDLPADQDHVVHPELLDSPVTPAPQESLARFAKCPELQADQEHQVPQDLKDLPEAPDSPERQDRTVVLDPQETTVHPDLPEKQARPETRAHRETKEPKALATTAHLHVPLPDIKRKFFATTTTYESLPIPKRLCSSHLCLYLTPSSYPNILLFSLSVLYPFLRNPGISPPTCHS